MIHRANRVYEILCGGKFEFHASTGDLNWIIYICLPWFIVIFQLITGFASAFVHSIPLFAVLRFMVGFGLTGVMLSLYIYGMELVGPNSRTAAGNITYFYYNGFQMLFVLIAYLERDWRNLSLIASVPAALLFPFWKYVHNNNVFLLSLSLSLASFFADCQTKQNLICNSIGLFQNPPDGLSLTTNWTRLNPSSRLLGAKMRNL